MVADKFWLDFFGVPLKNDKIIAVINLSASIHGRRYYWHTSERTSAIILVVKSINDQRWSHIIKYRRPVMVVDTSRDQRKKIWLSFFSLLCQWPFWVVADIFDFCSIFVSNMITKKYWRSIFMVVNIYESYHLFTNIWRIDFLNERSSILRSCLLYFVKLFDLLIFFLISFKDFA